MFMFMYMLHTSSFSITNTSISSSAFTALAPPFDQCQRRVQRRSAASGVPGSNMIWLLHPVLSRDRDVITAICSTTKAKQPAPTRGVLTRARAPAQPASRRLSSWSSRFPKCEGPN